VTGARRARRVADGPAWRKGVVLPADLSRPGAARASAATLASRATPKWLLRHMAGRLARKAV
jgi:hypothetical protein